MSDDDEAFPDSVEARQQQADATRLSQQIERFIGEQHQHNEHLLALGIRPSDWPCESSPNALTVSSVLEWLEELLEAMESESDGKLAIRLADRLGGDRSSLAPVGYVHCAWVLLQRLYTTEQIAALPGEQPKELSQWYDVQAELRRVRDFLKPSTVGQERLPDWSRSNEAVSEVVHELAGDGADLDANDTALSVKEQAMALPSTAANGPSATSVNEFELYQHGENYVVAGFGESGIVQNILGFEYIRRLVAAPKQPIPMLDLYRASEDIRIKSDSRSKQDTLDAAARNELGDKIVELQGEVNEAEEWNDDVRAEALRMELDKLKEHAASAIGLRGRSRDLNNPLEKLRPKLLGALKRAYAVLRTAKMPTVAEHLEASISSVNGTLIYAPAGLEISWQIVKQ